MRILGTTNNKIGSYLIRKITKSEISHIAFVFDEKIIIQSSLNGVELAWFNTFQKHNKIVDSVEFKLGLEKEEAIWQAIINRHDDDKYDYKAILFQAIWRGIMLLTGTVIKPVANLLDSNNRQMCVEMYGIVSENVPTLPQVVYLSSLSPAELMDILKK